MKKYIIFSIILVGLSLNSCSSSFLEQDPPLYIEPEDIYSSPERLESTVLGLYGAIKNSDKTSFLGGKTYLVFDNRSEDLVNVDPNLVTLANTYKMKVGATDSENSTTWNSAYEAINKVNTFLEGLEGAKEVAGNKYEQYKAEAKFVRAISYFYLNNLYSLPYSIDPNAKSVPLRLTAQKDTEDNAKARSSVKEIYEQILKDLEGLNALPIKETPTEASVTRATQAAANMLKMRTYMAMNNWDEAIKAGKEVKGYALSPAIGSMFKTPYYTAETIFSLPMALTNKPNTQQGLAEYYAAKTKIMAINSTSGIMALPHYNLAADQRTLLKNADGRLEKFTDTANKLDWAPIFRYAETLLNLAECYANIAGGEANAKEYLKEVRSRSIPAGDDLDVDALSGDALKTAIYNERRLEFIGEAIRGIDVIRRGETFKNANVKPEDTGYIWPIPQTEQLLNPDINK